MQCAMSVHVFEFKLNIFQSNIANVLLVFFLQIIAKMKKGESVDEDVD